MEQLQEISKWITPILQQNQVSLYDIGWRQEHGMKILQIAIMDQDGRLDLDVCTAVSEEISLLLDEKDCIPFEYYLEICSPGAERPLKTEQQRIEAIGSHVCVSLVEPTAGVDEVIGTLLSYDETGCMVEYMAKNIRKTMNVLHENIRAIRLAIQL